VPATEARLEELRGEIKDAEDRILEIQEDEDDYIRENDVKTVFNLRWIEFHEKNIGSGIDGFSYASLRWFCSRLGQEAFKLFDLDVRLAAERGERSIELRCEDSDPQVFVSNDSGTFSGKFPSWFDLKESFTVLGYKISDRKSSPKRLMVIRW
jgi:hypothetical protein